MYISEIEIVAFYIDDKTGEAIDIITVLDVFGKKNCFNLSGIRNYKGVKSWLDRHYHFDRVNWSYFKKNKTAIFYPSPLYGKPIYNPFKTFWLRIFTERGGFLNKETKIYLAQRKLEKEKLFNNFEH